MFALVWNICMGLWCYHSGYRMLKNGLWTKYEGRHRSVVVVAFLGGTIIIAGAFLMHFWKP
jgi:hypothetical protein